MSDPASDDTQLLDGQPQDNYEKRFKGLQTEYNKLKTQYDTQTGALTRLQTEFNDFRSTSTNASTDLQTQLAQTRAERDAHAKTIEQAQQENQSLKAQAAKYESRESTRKLILDQKATDLLPLYESGLLNLDGVTPEQLPEKLAAFRGQLEGFVKGTLDSKFSGSAPPPPAGTPPAGEVGGDVDSLHSWLMNPANFGKPNFAQVQSQYYEAVARKNK